MAGNAVVCAGQGAQFAGMGKDLAEAHPECRALFERADAVLGYSLSALCFGGPAEELTRSDRCQPAIFVTSVACHRALLKVRPATVFAAAAGLSLGEWTALHLAGALGFDETLRVLEARGRFMQEACAARPGGMVSVIGLGADALQEVCRQAGVEMANLNSPEQIVLSGDKDRIAPAAELAAKAGAKKTVVLNVAGAFHSSLMAPAAARLEEVLRGVAFQAPRVPVVANTTGRPHGGPDDIRREMVRQVTSSVRWCDGIQWMRAQGVGTFVECGPGKILAGLIKRIDKAAAAHSIQDAATLNEAAAALA